MLSSLSNDLKVKIAKRACKQQMPESCQTHDWVISELLKLESHNDQVFSWFKLEQKALCKFFLQGNCRRSNCRFSHDQSKVADQSKTTNISISLLPNSNSASRVADKKEQDKAATDASMITEDNHDYSLIAACSRRTWFR
jgi:hypothetical protein